MTWNPEQNRDYQREYQRRRREDPEYRAQHNAQSRTSYERNADKKREYSRRYRETHLEERREYNRAYAQRNRDGKRLLRYGLTVEQYDTILAAQGGGCAVCGVPPEDGERKLQIDHDHKCCPGRKSCGKCIRGLLCNRHNLGIGLLGDCLEQIMPVIAYLQRPYWAAQ